MTFAICPTCRSSFNNHPFNKAPNRVTTYCSVRCANNARKKHGHTTHDFQSRTYNTYYNMIGRCHRVGHAKFERYGAVGIFVCARWRASFENFLADMGERPDGTTIDRIDGALGYCKDNCRWATPKEQQANIRTNVSVSFNGRTQNVAAWAEELGIDACGLAWRLRNGWTVEQAFFMPRKLGNKINTTGQVLLEYKGETKCVSHWAKTYGLSISLLRLRLSKGWNTEAALTTPKGRFVVKGDHVPPPANRAPSP